MQAPEVAVEVVEESLSIFQLIAGEPLLLETGDHLRSLGAPVTRLLNECVKCYALLETSLAVGVLCQPRVPLIGNRRSDVADLQSGKYVMLCKYISLGRNLVLEEFSLSRKNKHTDEDSW